MRAPMEKNASLATQILDEVRCGGGISCNDIAENIGRDSHEVTRALRLMQAQGKIRKGDKERSGAGSRLAPVWVLNEKETD